MSDFARDITRTIAHEGGATVTNYPWDPGGLTKFGISKRAHPNVDVANLTLEEAEAIYRSDYWTPLGAETMPEPLAYNALDLAVNAGVGRAKQLLTVPAIVLPADANALLWARAQFYLDVTRANVAKLRAKTKASSPERMQGEHDEYAKLYGWLTRTLAVRKESAT